MARIPSFPFRDSSFNEASLTDAALMQIAIGEHQIQFHWDNGISVYAESDILIVDSTGRHSLVSGGHAAAPLLRFISMSACRIQFEVNQHMSVDMADGSCLRLIVKDSGYESFQVQQGEDWLLIW